MNHNHGFKVYDFTPPDSWYEPDDFDFGFDGPFPSDYLVADLYDMWDECDPLYVERVQKFLADEGHDDLRYLPLDIFNSVYDAALAKLEEK